jgi:hypothetical protein
VTSLLKVSVCAGLASLALLCAVAQPAHAAAKANTTPCWKVLLNDWYDGRIDGTYPRHCYTDALKHLPADVSTYSSAHDDILRAMQSAISKQHKLGQKVGPNTLIHAPAAPKTGPGSKSGGSNAGSKGSSSKTGTTTSTGRQQGKGLAGGLNPSSPSSLPVPLLILGGLALVLVAAGGAGLVAKRIQARRQNP